MIEQDTQTLTSPLTVEAAIMAAAAQSGGVFRFPRGPAVVATSGHPVSLTRILVVLDQMEVRGGAIHLERGAHLILDALGRISPLAIGAHLVASGYVSLWTAAD